MVSCIRSVRDDHLIVYFRGMIMTKINDSYNQLKYGEFEGNRVEHKFDDEATIQETYDDRIFNCFYKGETMQIRKSEELCDLITDRSKDGYVKLFKLNYYEVHKTEILTKLVSDSYGERVRIRNGEYIIDDRFMVDEHGTAHYHTRRTKKKIDMTDEYGKQFIPKTWNSICIVVKGTGSTQQFKTDIGLVDIEPKLMEILSKINFLIHPNITDHIFTSQLPEWLMKTLVAEQEAKV